MLLLPPTTRLTGVASSLWLVRIRGHGPEAGQLNAHLGGEGEQDQGAFALVVVVQHFIAMVTSESRAKYIER